MLKKALHGPIITKMERILPIGLLQKMILLGLWEAFLLGNLAINWWKP